MTPTPPAKDKKLEIAMCRFSNGLKLEGSQRHEILRYLFKLHEYTRDLEQRVWDLEKGHLSK